MAVDVMRGRGGWRQRYATQGKGRHDPFRVGNYHYTYNHNRTCSYTHNYTHNHNHAQSN